MNFLPTPTPINCPMLISHPVLWFFRLSACSAIRLHHHSLSFLKLQLFILTILSSLLIDTLTTHFKNKAKEQQQNQHSLFKSEHTSSCTCSPLRSQVVGKVIHPGRLCLSTLHSQCSLTHATPLLKRCTSTWPNDLRVTKFNKRFPFLPPLDLSTVFDV